MVLHTIFVMLWEEWHHSISLDDFYFMDLFFFLIVMRLTVSILL